ncbi:MAG: hypothetical protein JWQ27_1856 [Ferruginibacter sp.]|nr:hypothetical protein [Ferruginibacter sp.]
MHRGFLITAAILAALSVAMGAFAAHALKDLISERAIVTFETGVRYQFYHVFALFITAIIYQQLPAMVTKIAGWLFGFGILLFSGSLYLLAFMQATVKPGYDWIGAITPIGGTAFIAGWICLLIAATKIRHVSKRPE